MILIQPTRKTWLKPGESRPPRKNRGHSGFDWSTCIICALFGLSHAVWAEVEIKNTSIPALDLSGYTQICYAHEAQDQSGFRIRQARVQLRGKILKNFEYKFQVDAAKTPILLDAGIGIRVAPYLKFTFGQFKLPFSIENLVSGSELDTINRSQVVNNLCPGRDSGDMGRDIGITMTGKISRLECTLGLFNGSGINTKDDNRLKDVALRFLLRPLGALSVGLSHYMGRDGPQSENPVIEKNRTGVDLSLIQDPITLKGEFIYARDGQVDRYGWYIQTGCFLLRHKLQVIIKYDFFDRDMALPGDCIRVATVGLNYHFLKKTKFQINCEYRRDESCLDPDLVFLTQLQAGF